MYIDVNKLKIIEKEKKKDKAFSDSLLLSSFVSIIDNIINTGSKMKKMEMAMFINSIQHWLSDREKKKKSKKCSYGTIVELELGLPYKTETPYRHSALVMKEYKNKILIVPSTSKKEFIEIAYHPIDNPDGDKYFRKVSKEDGFDHDCVLVLNDFKVVSKNRIISTCGIVDTTSDKCLYKEIRKNLLENIFEDEILEYEKRIEELNKIIELDNESIHDKKEKINSLYRKINQKNNYIKRLKSKSS